MIPRRQKDWEHGPVYYRRRQWPFRIAAMVMGFTPLVFRTTWMMAGAKQPRLALAVGFGWLAVSIVVLAWMYLRLRRGVGREFEAAGGRLCTHCGYNLKDLPDRGGCPECGHEFDAEFDAKTWAGAGFVVRRPLEPPSSDA